MRGLLVEHVDRLYHDHVTGGYRAGGELASETVYDVTSSSGPRSLMLCGAASSGRGSLVWVAVLISREIGAHDDEVNLVRPLDDGVFDSGRGRGLTGPENAFSWIAR